MSPIADNSPDTNVLPPIVNDPSGESGTETCPTAATTIPTETNDLSLMLDEETWDYLVQWHEDNQAKITKEMLDHCLAPTTHVSDQGNNKRIGISSRLSEFDEYDCTIAIQITPINSTNKNV